MIEWFIFIRNFYEWSYSWQLCRWMFYLPIELLVNLQDDRHIKHIGIVFFHNFIKQLSKKRHLVNWTNTYFWHIGVINFLRTFYVVWRVRVYSQRAPAPAMSPHPLNSLLRCSVWMVQISIMMVRAQESSPWVSELSYMHHLQVRNISFGNPSAFPKTLGQNKRISSSMSQQLCILHL